MLRLDSRDLEILRILSREGRIAKADLAKRINLSTSPAWERLKRLETAGIIAGYHAEIALRAVAPHLTIFVTLELERHGTESFRAFETLIENREEVLGCWALGGGFDYLMQIVTRDIDSYQAFMEELLRDSGGIARYYTYVVTKPVKTGAPPPLELLMKPTEPGG
ncbi:AsnC family transcriptional regulator [Rhodobacteraceae bacterium WD3A24]|nr:AsnC family transcriptional regulator [Rhodobacteraceae bacterium WD3A24]